MIDEFIENSEEFNLWSVDDRKQLRERAMHAKCPGFLMLVANLSLKTYPKNEIAQRNFLKLVVRLKNITNLHDFPSTTS
jgi:hypothetical protein